MRKRTFGTLGFSLLISWSFSIHNSTSSGSQFNQNGWNSTAKLGAQTEKVKNEVPLLILLDFFGCYCFSILISGVSPLRQHDMLTTFFPEIAGPSSGTHHPPSAKPAFRIRMDLHNAQSVHCDRSMFLQRKIWINMSFPQHRRNKLHNSKFIWCISYNFFFFLFNQHWTIKKCHSAETFQNVWSWGPWQDNSSNHTSSFKFLLWFSHCQIEPGNAHESWPENLAPNGWQES